MRKILLIDENKNMKKLLITIIEDIKEDDIIILEEDDIDKAVHVINNEIPDIVFIHGINNKLEDNKIYKLLNGHIKLKKIKVVLLTTKEDNYHNNFKKNTGIDLYLYKPFDPDFLLLKLCDMLNINYI